MTFRNMLLSFVTKGTDSMVDGETPYRNVDIRDRIETVNDRLARAEGRQNGHELVCAERYKDLLEKVIQLKADLAMNAKIGLILAIMLFSIEFGKATFPALFEAIAHIHGVQ